MEIMEKVSFIYSRWATSLTSTKSKIDLQKRHISQFFAPNTPYLNQIEHLCGVIKKKSYKIEILKVKKILQLF